MIPMDRTLYAIVEKDLRHDEPVWVTVAVTASGAKDMVAAALQFYHDKTEPDCIVVGSRPAHSLEYPQLAEIPWPLCGPSTPEDYR